MFWGPNIFKIFSLGKKDILKVLCNPLASASEQYKIILSLKIQWLKIPNYSDFLKFIRWRLTEFDGCHFPS